MRCLNICVCILLTMVMMPRPATAIDCGRYPEECRGESASNTERNASPQQPGATKVAPGTRQNTRKSTGGRRITAASSCSALDLSKYKLTFNEGFDTLDVTAWGPSRWIAHTPWFGDFGDAKFVDPKPGFPFTTDLGFLRIEARKNDASKWESGILSSLDPKGNGFAQKYGYFEMRAKLPKGSGLWPAFWMIGKNRKTHTAEIDIIEHHGHKPGSFTSAVHVWDRIKPKNRNSRHKVTRVEPGSLYDRFNLFGVSIDENSICIYFNREPVWHAPTQEQHRQPMYLLVNLAMGSGFPVDKAPNPSYMFVDYVKAWALK